MKDLLKTVETFLTYSEAKLEELSEKNQQLKTELPRGGEEASMKKLLIAATVVLVSSSPLVLLPMEKELTLTPKQVQKLTQNTTASLTQFKQIPKNPRTITTILTYKNKDLTEFKTSIQADTKLSISAIFWNAKGEPVFQLQDGDYVAASQKSIVDDSIYNQKTVDMTFWTKDGIQRTLRFRN